MKFDSRFALGEVVFLRHGEEKGVVVGVTFIPGSCLYTVTWSDGNRGDHYALELTNDAGDRFGAKE